MSKIPCFLNEDLLKSGIKAYEHWFPDKAPHLAFSGPTGSGKTYALKLLLAKVSKYDPASQIVLCDFKGDRDFDYLTGCKEFFRFDECVNGFNGYYNDFVGNQKNPKTNTPMKILVFDEWASFTNFLDKKDAEDMKKKLASLLMLGRSFNYHIILSQQRLDADSFNKSRDNLNVLITLGNPSKEAVGMLYSDFKDQIIADRSRGTGYMLTNGSDFKKIVVPTINDLNAAEMAIKRAVERASTNDLASAEDEA